MARTIESAQELTGAIYDALRKLQAEHEVDLVTLDDYVKDAFSQLQVEEMSQKRMAGF